MQTVMLCKQYYFNRTLKTLRCKMGIIFLPMGIHFLAIPLYTTFFLSCPLDEINHPAMKSHNY
jgi:hypothetical protein